MRIKRREEMQRYRRQLVVLMAQEEAEHKELDAFLAKYNAEKEAQQDAEFARRREQRQKLIEVRLRRGEGAARRVLRCACL